MSASDKAIAHSFGYGVPGISATRTPPSAPVVTITVLGVDPGATIGAAILRVSRGNCEWIDSWSGRSVGYLRSWLAETGAHGRRFDLVAIETAAVVYPRAGFGTYMATALMDAAKIGGELRGQAIERGLSTQEATAAAARKALVGLAQPSDAQVKSALGRAVKLPKFTNAHVRDAAVVALYCGRRALLGIRS